MVQVIMNDDKYILFSIYITPNPSSDTIEDIKKYFNYLSQKFNENKIIICGDLNIDYLSNSKPIVKAYINLINEYGYKQIVNSYTYPSKTKYSKKPSLIDHILVNSDLVSYYNVNESISDSCDQLLIDFVISVQTSKTKTENYILFDYRK